MNTQHTSGRLLVLLLLTIFTCSGLYFLPDTLWGVKIKKVDLLADIRIKSQAIPLDTLQKQLEREDTLKIDTMALRISAIESGLIDSSTIALRDSLYRQMIGMPGADSLGIRIEDYAAGHTGLKRFFKALNQCDRMDRPVRIAFMGDSFIEGDIVVADFREEMQKRFGGRGVGFVPVTSTTEQFRPTTSQKAEGWSTFTLSKDDTLRHILSGMVFKPDYDRAVISFKTSDYLASLQEVSSLKFLYGQHEEGTVKITINDTGDTLIRPLDGNQAVNQIVIRKDSIRNGAFEFNGQQGLHAYGLALEDENGINVDNFSLRGNLGYVFEQLDPEVCRSLCDIRPYDLIILQYGLNVVSEDIFDYGWYRQRMIELIRHLKNCFPESDFLLLGVSDRASLQDGEFRTMPEVFALLYTQRQIARQTGIAFWNVFGAMGGENSMVRYVEKNWGSKDFSHLSFRGGKEIAKAFTKALLLEKSFYDEAEKIF